MERVYIFEYMKRTGILEDLAYSYVNIPNNVEDLLVALEREEMNFWSYSAEDKDEIKDIKNTILVYDLEGTERYFELTETEEF